MARPRETAEDIARRLDAGEPLGPTQIARMLGISRYSVDHYLNDGVRIPGEPERWYPRYDRSIGGQRKVPAEDVRKLISLRRTGIRGRQPDRHRDPPASDRNASDSQ